MAHIYCKRFSNVLSEYPTRYATANRITKNVMLTYDIITGRGGYFMGWIPTNNIYRVALHPDMPTVEVLSIGAEATDDSSSVIYSSVTALPDWIQERLSVMLMLSATPPTENVPGIGRRISTYVFWMETPKEDETNG